MAQAVQLAEVERQVRAACTKKEGREILSDFANLFAGIASKFQPAKDDATGMPKWEDAAHRAIFIECAHRACIYAHWVAPYESPTFKAIAVQMAPDMEKLPKPVETNAVPLDDDHAAMRVYRQIVQGSRLLT